MYKDYHISNICNYSGIGSHNAFSCRLLKKNSIRRSTWHIGKIAVYIMLNNCLNNENYC